ncbi:DUF2306 domain-containing protein [Sphingomonas bacterium]|uniref:DUF2306 domain-containing protein n=1 Tax=Sphingomonas bacterium TaxID=1895847 RepID=UPI001575364B|nr:DUF2306 domain-containing protein [Sphingomonas bacterium]
MTTLAISSPFAPDARPKLLAAGAGLVSALLLVAASRRMGSGVPVALAGVSPWLVLHLATVLPALPLGAYVFLRRKGDRLHRLLGRVWALLMVSTALFSFGVQTSGHLSWIHLFSVLILVTVPRGVILAMRGDIAGHKRAMQRIYMGMVIAGLFTFIPGRLLGDWLLG